MSRPNILYIITDQQSATAMSCAGNSDLKTPAMDSLGEIGVRFEHCYCSNPLCTPARASLFTGRMPHEIGITGNGLGIPSEARDSELGVLLRNAGYECNYAGKWHVPEISMPDGAHGFSTISSFDDDAVSANCASYLVEEHSEPFFLVAAFDNPHNICEWAREQPLPWSRNIVPPSADRCPELPENFETGEEEPEAIRRIVESQPKVYGTPSLCDEKWWRALRFAYYRLVEHVDSKIGAVLQALQSSIHSDNTLVVFTSDHGDANGAHRLKQKSFLYQEQTNVPLIVVPPGKTGIGKSGARESANAIVDSRNLIAGGLDVYATILDYAGISIPTKCDGISVRRIVDRPENADKTIHRDAVIVETTTGDASSVGVDGRMVRTSRYKYVAYSWGRYREQLFDLESDPGEMLNLAYREEYAAERDRHREILLSWCNQTGDTFGATYGHPGIPTVPGFEYR